MRKDLSGLEQLIGDTKPGPTNCNLSQQICERISFIMAEKGINQTELSKRLNKYNSVVYKMLQPSHNWTLRSITQIEIALGEKIIKVVKP